MKTSMYLEQTLDPDDFDVARNVITSHSNAHPHRWDLSTCFPKGNICMTFYDIRSLCQAPQALVQLNKYITQVLISLLICDWHKRTMCDSEGANFLFPPSQYRTSGDHCFL